MHDLLVKQKVDRVVIEAEAQAGMGGGHVPGAGALRFRWPTPTGEAWRWKNVKNKSDRNDCPEAGTAERDEAVETRRLHVPPKPIRQWRSHSLIQCHTLVGRRTADPGNGLHALERAGEDKRRSKAGARRDGRGWHKLIPLARVRPPEAIAVADSLS